MTPTGDIVTNGDLIAQEAMHGSMTTWAVQRGLHFLGRVNKRERSSAGKYQAVKDRLTAEGEAVYAHFTNLADAMRWLGETTNDH